VLDFLQKPMAAVFPQVTYLEVSTARCAADAGHLLEPTIRKLAHRVHAPWLQSRLKAETAALAKGYDTVCCFVNDRISEQVLALACCLHGSQQHTVRNWGTRASFTGDWRYPALLLPLTVASPQHTCRSSRRWLRAASSTSP
jgi:hypothetical protein